MLKLCEFVYLRSDGREAWQLAMYMFSGDACEKFRMVEVKICGVVR